MERPVEVAVFDRGELQSVRVLSPGRERWAAILAAAHGGDAGAGGHGGAAALLSGVPPGGARAHLLRGLAGGGGRWSDTCPRAGSGPGWRSYRLGADIEADAFAMAEVELLRRAGDDYELGLVPGHVRRLRAPALQRADRGVHPHRPGAPAAAPAGQGPGRDRVPAPSSSAGGPRPAGRPFPLAEWLSWVAAGPIRRVAALGRAGHADRRCWRPDGVGADGATPMTEVEDRFAIPADATPARGRAADPGQGPVPDPARCTPASIRCRCPASGRATSGWACRCPRTARCCRTGCRARPTATIARSPAAWQHVVAGWSFEPMPERMNVVIPIAGDAHAGVALACRPRTSIFARPRDVARRRRTAPRGISRVWRSRIPDRP